MCFQNHSPIRKVHVQFLPEFHLLLQGRLQVNRGRNLYLLRLSLERLLQAEPELQQALPALHIPLLPAPRKPALLELIPLKLALLKRGALLIQ